MASNQATPFVTPVGRLVQGDVFTPQTTDDKGEALLYKTGPNAGKPRTQYFIAVAFAKNDPAWPAFYAVIHQAAQQGYPQFFNAQGQCVSQNFSFKVIDGDGYDNNAKPNSEKTGFAGHWVVRFSSSYAPKVVHGRDYLNNPDSIKRGYYVRVAGDVAPNIGSQTPGVYMNHSAVELVGYGEEIRGGIDALGVFGAAGAVALPAGASATPIAAPGGIMGGMPGAPMQQPMAPMQQPMAPMQQPMAPTPMRQSVAPQAPMQQPNHAFVQNAIGAPQAPMQQPMAPMQQPMAPMQQPMAPAPQLIATPAAQGFTLQQWKDAGHTEESLIAQGMFTRG